MVTKCANVIHWDASARAEDFEGVGVYFMSDASRFHTGDLVKIDGGWMANAGKSNLATGRRG